MPKNASHYVKKGLLSQPDYNFLAEIDPSKTKKYLAFIIKSYLSGINLDLLRNRVTEYDTLLSRNQADRKDINTFKTFHQLDMYVQHLNNKKSGKERKRDIKKEAEIVLDTERIFIVVPRSHAASCLYGAGTKWCITANNPVHWNKYHEALITFYYVQFRDEAWKNVGRNLWKLAVAVYPNGTIMIYDAVDQFIATVGATMKFAPLDDFLGKLGIDRATFIPRGLEERTVDFSGRKLKRTLKKLDLSKKDISIIPNDIGKMTELETLVLLGNSIQSIPESIGQLTELETLILSENKIESLPESIGQLAHLKTLYLFHNRLTSLPDSLGNLKGLQWLGLTGNRISNKAIRELKRKLPHTRIYTEKKKLLNFKAA